MHLIRADLYRGQPCGSDGAYILIGLIGYYRCDHFSERERHNSDANEPEGRPRGRGGLVVICQRPLHLSWRS